MQLSAESIKTTEVMAEVSKLRQSMRAVQNADDASLQMRATLSMQRDADTIEELSTRINVLEAQNGRLKGALNRQEQAMSMAAAAPGLAPAAPAPSEPAKEPAPRPSMASAATETEEWSIAAGACPGMMNRRCPASKAAVVEGVVHQADIQ